MEGGRGQSGKRKNSTKVEARLPKVGKRTCDSIWSYPEVLEQILKNIDFQRLKIFRSVCKLWNQEICRLLQATSYLEIDGAKLGRDSRFLDLLKPGKKLKLPSPFKSISMTPSISDDVSSGLGIDRQLSTHVSIVKLTLLTSLVSPTPEVVTYAMKFLHLCSQTLMHLEIQYWDAKEFRPKVPLRLPLLTGLVLRRSLIDDRHYKFGRHTSSDESAFFQSIISSSPCLKRLTINGVKSMLHLLQTADLKMIEELTLTSGFLDDAAYGTESFVQLENVRIDNLKVLNVVLIRYASTSLQQAFLNFTHSLERLSFDHFPDNFPCCPRVTHLKVRSCTPGDVDSSVLPTLKSVKFECFWASGSDVKLQLFPNVKDVCFNKVKLYNAMDHGIAKKRIALAELMSRFPNATRWTVPYKYLPDFIQVAAEFELQVEWLRVSLLGNRDRKECKVKDVKVVDTEAFSSLHLLSDLKELELYNHELLDKSRNLAVDAIDFTKLPNLKRLRHFGKGIKSYVPLIKRLQHLDTVDVVFDRLVDVDEARASLKFLTRMPNLTVDLRSIDFAKYSPYA